MEPPLYSGSASSISQTAPQASGSTTTESLAQRLVCVLEIPPHLVGSGKVNLQMSYQKYLAFLQAKNKLETVGWQGKKPMQVDLIQLFASKSYFFSHHKKFFPKVAAYPELDAWLREKEDRLSNVEVWGVEKAIYTFEDLDKFFVSGGTLASEDEEDVFDRKGKKKQKSEQKKKEKKKKKEKIDEKRDKKKQRNKKK
jgi:hypothetical protein